MKRPSAPFLLSSLSAEEVLAQAFLLSLSSAWAGIRIINAVGYEVNIEEISARLILRDSGTCQPPGRMINGCPAAAINSFWLAAAQILDELFNLWTTRR